MILLIHFFSLLYGQYERDRELILYSVLIFNNDISQANTFFLIYYDNAYYPGNGTQVVDLACLNDSIITTIFSDEALFKQSQLQHYIYRVLKKNKHYQTIELDDHNFVLVSSCSIVADIFIVKCQNKESTPFKELFDDKNLYILKYNKKSLHRNNLRAIDLIKILTYLKRCNYSPI